MVTKQKKGTKYLYCPRCEKQVAYFNFLPMLAGLATKAVAKKLLVGAGVGVASAIGGHLIKKKLSKQEDETPLGHQIIDYKDIPNNLAKEMWYDEQARRR
jgi:DNA polymerase III alpha subunit (gram-positive type)